MNENPSSGIPSQQAATYQLGDLVPAVLSMLKELLKTSEIQQLFDAFYNLVDIPIAVLDIHGDVLLSSKWNRICTQFHRTHPVTCAHCVESDTMLAQQIDIGQPYKIYQCLNGMTECSAPIILEGQHIANLFAGQFLVNKPDEIMFHDQALQYGFDVDDYLTALREVPIVDETRMPKIIDLLIKMTHVIARLSVDRIRTMEDHNRQALILETLPLSVFWKDADGTYLGCNTRFATAVGLSTPDEIAGKSDYDFVSVSRADGFRKEDQDIIASHQPKRTVQSVTKKDGSHITVQIVKTPIVGAFGSSTGVLGIYEDITKRKEAEDALRQSYSHYQAVFNNAIEGIYEATIQGQALSANPAFVQMLGYDSVEDALSKLDDVALTLWADPNERAVVLKLVDMNGWVRGYECQYRRKDGRLIYIALNATVVRVSDGEDYYLASIQDITERKEAEAKLRHSYVHYRTVFENAIEGIYEATLHGKALSANPAFVEMLGYDSEEEVVSILTDIPHQLWADPDERSNVLHMIDLNGCVRGYECEFKRRDGSIIHVMLNATVVRRPDHNDYYLASVQDISEKKQAEVKRLQLEDQLRSSQKLEAIGRLAGGVAHDFNNLLSVILGYTGLTIAMVDDDDPLKENIQEIQNAAQHAAALTRQLLAFGRKQVLQPVVFDLNQIIHGIKTIFDRTIGETIDQKLLLSPQIGLIKADPSQIEQVLMNLVVNARDAMPDGGQITIETSKMAVTGDEIVVDTVLSPGMYVKLAVSDTGMGMDANTKARIFDPFYTTKEFGKGTGLGLSTVYGIVKQSGGDIWVDSEPGYGSTFNVIFPCFNAVKPASMNQPQISLMDTTGTETIMVVDNEESLRLVATKVLTDAGYTVLCAVGGNEAIDMARKHSGDIDLLLADVIMPGMDGRATANELIRICPSIKVVFMSGHTRDEIEHHGVIYGDTNYLAKPFSADELKVKIREILSFRHPS